MESSQVTISGVTAKQVQRLMSLIKPPKGEYEKLMGKLACMLDNGALTHMTGDKELLSKTKSVPLVLIKLPNGTHILATKQCTVGLG